MAQFGFITTNAYRTYPFIDNSSLLDVDADASIDLLETLPESAIVDFGAIMSLNALYDDVQDSVYLYEIRRDGSLLAFEFRTTATGAEDFVLVFLRNVSDPPFTITREVAYSPDEVSLSISSDCHTDDVTWEGFLITGPLDDLLELLPGDGALTFNPAYYQIEPARMQNLARSFVRSFNLANFDRTRVIPSEACGGEPAEEKAVLMHAECLTGDIKLIEGFNCVIRQEPSTNSIIIGASVGLGSGLACEEVPLTDDEEPPDDGTLLTGGPTCNEIIKSINGLSATAITIQSGAGIDVQPHVSAPHTLVVNAHLKGFQTCEPST